jgi:hypothetical protein
MKERLETADGGEPGEPALLFSPRISSDFAVSLGSSSFSGGDASQDCGGLAEAAA